jgi:CRP-like cAMP-binding protein
MQQNADTDIFFNKMSSYHPLSEEARAAWLSILRKKTYKKGENFVAEGQQPHKTAFVLKGLFSQYYTSANGDVVIKYFFPELRLAASLSAMLTKTPSMFTIEAIEPTTVLEYDFFEFKRLTREYPDVAGFYINYIERHWIVEKEPFEISLRHDSAKIRYEEFTIKYPQLIKRLKKHHIASYLGITPTQLSRIFFANK